MYKTFVTDYKCTLDTDRLKAIAGKYGKVSKKGLYSGMALGRLGGGYLGFQLGDAMLPGAELIELYPVIDPGQFGPEEQAVYAAVVAGYFAGGLGVAKAVTRYQESREKDLEYTRPFLTPVDGLKKVKEMLDGEENAEEELEALKSIFDDEE